MERLTYDFCIGGNHCWQVKGADNLECREICERQEDEGCKSCPIAKAFDRLAAYENTGLDPEEISQLKTAVSDIKADVEELFEKQKFLKFLESKGVDIQAGVNWMCDVFDALNDDVIDLARLRELVEADRDGRCVVLSCKHGDTVWFIKSAFSWVMYPIEARHVSIRGIDCDGDIIYSSITVCNGLDRKFKESDIGKTVFLTREAAEEALKGENNEIK